MVTHIKGNDIADCWEKIVVNIVNNGHYVNDERGSLTKECLNIVTEIKDPFSVGGKDFFGMGDALEKLENIRIPKGYFWEGDKLQTYADQFISPENPGFVYTYGNRLRAHFDKVDQIQESITRLKNCRESRRAISITWDQVIDSTSEEVPCMILIDFKIRGNVLYTTALWRSHDIYGAWFANAVGLTYCAKYVSEEIGDVKLGPITIHSISAHIYENNFDEAEKLAKSK